MDSQEGLINCGGRTADRNSERFGDSFHIEQTCVFCKYLAQRLIRIWDLNNGATLALEFGPEYARCAFMLLVANFYILKNV